MGLSFVGMTSCSDPDEPITSVEYNRLFSPTELEAKVQNTTGVKLTWFSISAAENVNIEIYADDADMTFQMDILGHDPQFAFIDGNKTGTVRTDQSGMGILQTVMDSDHI